MDKYQQLTANVGGTIHHWVAVQQYFKSNSNLLCLSLIMFPNLLSLEHVILANKDIEV